MERVIAYIDGFNLYFGLRSKGWQRYFWLDVQTLSQHLLKPSQVLIQTKYFTSRVASPPDKVKRQALYIEALETLSDFSIFYGQYQRNPYTCRKCGAAYQVPSEKMTDVNIAVEMLQDAFQDAFDTALLISADSDLVGPITAVKRLFPQKRVVVAFPPDRASFRLSTVASAYFQIGRASLAKSLFQEQITTKTGYVLRQPPSWK